MIGDSNPKDKSPGYFLVVPEAHEKTLVSFLSDDDCPAGLYDEDVQVRYDKLLTRKFYT